MYSEAISEEIENFPFKTTLVKKDQCIFTAPVFESMCYKAHPAWGSSCQIGNYKDLIEA